LYIASFSLNLKHWINWRSRLFIDLHHITLISITTILSFLLFYLTLINLTYVISSTFLIEITRDSILKSFIWLLVNTNSVGIGIFYFIKIIQFNVTSQSLMMLLIFRWGVDVQVCLVILDIFLTILFWGEKGFETCLKHWKCSHLLILIWII
jgi:hypothetical protein